MDELLSEFLIQTRDRLTALEPRLAGFQNAPDDAAVLRELMELFHTVRGASALLALPRLQAVAQAAEKLIRGMRDGSLDGTPEIAAVIGETIGAIRRIQRSLATAGVEPPGDDAALLATLAEAAAGRMVARVASPVVEAEADRPAAPSPGAVTPRGAAFPAQGSVTVPLERLDHLTALVGDLVLTRNVFDHLLREREDAELEEPMRRLSDITSDLGQGLMATRRLAFGSNEGSGAVSFDIVRVISLTCAGACYVIPQRDVVEIVRVTPSGRPVEPDEVRLLRYRERRYRWIRLAGLLAAASPPIRSGEPEIVVIIDGESGPIGFAVDTVIDIEEAVVRPLPAILRHIACFFGTTVLANGAVAIALDAKALARLVGTESVAGQPRALPLETRTR